MLKKVGVFFKKNWLISLIILLGLFLRAYHYSQFPISGETQDEVAWSMLGASLLQTRQPTSWSHFEAYKDDYVLKEITHVSPKNKGTQYILVSPVVDHPPLFGLIPGFFHSLKTPWDKIPSIKLIRFPMIIIGTVNLFLLYLVAQKIFRKKHLAHLATLVYAIIPSFVLGSRLVVAENLLITWMLLALYLLKSKANYKHILLIIISIAAVLTKVSGLVIPVGIFIYGWQNKEKQLLKSGLIGLVGGGLIYTLYGAFLNWDLFLEINLSQAGRSLGLATLANRFFLHPSLVAKIFFDGWIVLGLISLISLFLLHPKKYLLIKTYFVLWLAFTAATTGENTFHGWYNYPLYPLLSLSIAWFIHYLYTKNMFWLIWLSWLLVLPTIRLALIFTNKYSRTSNLFIRELLLLGALPLGFSLIKKRDLTKISILIIGGLLATASIIAIVFVNEINYWEMDQYFNIR